MHQLTLRKENGLSQDLRRTRTWANLLPSLLADMLTSENSGIGERSSKPQIGK
jgi:hypothetical protein